MASIPYEKQLNMGKTNINDKVFELKKFKKVNLIELGKSKGIKLKQSMKKEDMIKTLTNKIMLNEEEKLNKYTSRLEKMNTFQLKKYAKNKLINIDEKKPKKNIINTIIAPSPAIVSKLPTDNKVNYVGSTSFAYFHSLFLAMKRKNMYTFLLDKKIHDQILYTDLRIYPIEYVDNKFFESWISEKDIDNFYKSGCQFLMIPVGLWWRNKRDGHANSIIYNKKTKTIEIYEPHGVYTNIKGKKFRYNWIIRFLRSKGLNIVKNVIIGDNVVGMQYMNTQEQKLFNSDCGYCLAWSLWFVDYRLKHPSKDANYLFDKAFLELLYSGFKYHVRNYARYILRQFKYFLPNCDNMKPLRLSKGMCRVNLFKFKKYVDNYRNKGQTPNL